jgi:hypothetical protein
MEYDYPTANKQTLFPTREEAMESQIRRISQEHRRFFIGGSDARVIMGDDEAALLLPRKPLAMASAPSGPNPERSVLIS